MSEKSEEQGGSEEITEESSSALDLCQIKELTPHRYPFLFVDRVLSLVPGEKIVGIKNLSANEPFFCGHFPERAVMPGVLMIEALAQTAGILAKASPGFQPVEGNEYFLVGVTQAKWRRQVLPGDQLRLETRLLKKKRQLLVVEGIASVEGELACRATIQAAEAKV